MPFAATQDLKDQSYFLFELNQSQLAMAMFRWEIWRRVKYATLRADRAPGCGQAGQSESALFRMAITRPLLNVTVMK